MKEAQGAAGRALEDYSSSDADISVSDVSSTDSEQDQVVSRQPAEKLKGNERDKRNDDDIGEGRNRDKESSRKKKRKRHKDKKREKKREKKNEKKTKKRHKR